MEMIDGATAALEVMHKQQDKSERDYQTFGARVVEDLTAEIMEGKAVTKVRGIKVDLFFILDDEEIFTRTEQEAMLVASKEEFADILTIVGIRMKAHVVAWVNESDIAAAVIAERIRDRVMEAEEV